MSREPPGLAQALAGVESWAEAKTLLALAGAPAGLPAEGLAARVGLPVRALLPVIERLLARGLLQRVASGAIEAYALAPALQTSVAAEADAAPEAATAPAGNQPPGPPTRRRPRRAAASEPPPAGASTPPPIPSRQLAGALRQRYLELFGVPPNLPWLMRQRRQAADLGLDFDALLREVRFQRPEGNPQGYLEALLRRRAATRQRQDAPSS